MHPLRRRPIPPFRALLPTLLLLLAAPLLAVAETAGPAGAGLAGDRVATARGDLTIHPVNHGSLLLEWAGTTVYVDPVGGGERYRGLPAPDLILITHPHPDHLDVDTLQALGRAPIVAPAAVREKLPAPLAERTQVMANGDQRSVAGIPLTAVPAYNTTPERLQYHPKGRDNGYLLDLAGTRVYVAGDTEDTPEMRALRDIAVAFLPMNLPYTMTVQQAADAVRAFQPDIVYPYHYRGSDLGEFVRRVGEASEVRLREWY